MALLGNAKNFVAQHGEDRLLWQMFKQRRSGFYIEMGAYDGVGNSNTYFLEQMGWTGLLVEPVPALYEKAKATRPNSRVVNAACSSPAKRGEADFTVVIGKDGDTHSGVSYLDTNQFHRQRCADDRYRHEVIQVPVVTLDDLLEEERLYDWPGSPPWTAENGWQIDVVSLDTEGNEMDILAGFTLAKFRPAVLLIENDRPGLPESQKIPLYLAKQGYVRFHRQTINDFYLRRDLMAKP